MSDQHQQAALAGASFARLVALAARLRAPDGCPWDRQQTVQSSTPYILEEAYEAVDALESGDRREAMGELGDLLFQVVFQSQLAAEAGDFDARAVIEAVEAKMIRRHPHVFGQERAADAEAVLRRWSEIKRDERGASQGLLDSVPKGSAALTRAQRLGQKAARAGFDWRGQADVLAKVAEEAAELTAAADAAQREAEFGDLLFALAQWARHGKIDAEAALRRACERFQRRFELMEAAAAGRGVSLDRLDEAALDELWREAKAALAARQGVGGK